MIEKKKHVNEDEQARSVREMSELSDDDLAGAAGGCGACGRPQCIPAVPLPGAPLIPR